MGKVQTWTEPRCKVFGVPLSKNMDKQPDGTLIVRGYFTSDNRDEVGDIITRKATERAVPRYREWGNIRYMHMPRPVGKVLRIGEEDGLEWNEIEIRVVDPQTVFEVENGLLQALSVGILVDFDDVEFLEDGGWVINNYQLAEISLVDHPANYDARLKDLPVNEGLRMMARQYGFDSLARSMAHLLTRELDMEEKDIIIESGAVETEQVEEPVEKSIENTAEETVDGEAEAPAEEAEKDVAVEVSEESPFETIEVKDLGTDDVDEAANEDATEEKSEEAEVEKDLAGIVKDLAETVRSLMDAVAGIQKSVEALTVEAPKAEEQAEGDAEAEKAIVTEVTETVAEPVEEVADEPVGAPAERKGAVPETVIPEAQQENKSLKKPTHDLRRALLDYFNNR